MREHIGLYRGKRTDNGEWVQGNLVLRPSAIQIGNHSPWWISVPPQDPEDDGGIYRVDPDTVGECTGFTDAYGRVAYEHDITEDKWGKRWVIFGCAGGFGICRDIEWTRYADPTQGNYTGLADEQNAQWFFETAKIIGNIHDNPELLGGGDDGRA